MKKVGVVLFAFILAIIIVSAQNETLEDKAYACLEEKLGDNCGNSNSVEQLSFSLLAMAYNSGIQSDCKSALLDKQKSDNSFGSIKETSLAVIALDYVGKNTGDSEKWLLSKKKNSDLEWYLELDLEGQGKCSVTGGASITLNEDKKLSGSTGNCFSLAYDSYWLKIKDTCFDKNLTVSCDKDFMSTLIYKKSNSQVWHVSSDVQFASSNSRTEHKVNSYCFSSGAGCDYEGSLWAILALQRTDNSIKEYLPYIIAFAEDNSKYFPDSFLYILKSEKEYLSNILLLQKSSGEWKSDTSEYYDTALALLAIYGSASESESLAKLWLEEKQGNEGCWNNKNIRDTSFILWSIFSRTPVIKEGPSQTNCEPTYYCMSQAECEIDAGGKILKNYYCPGLKICCDTPLSLKTCTEMGGKECEAGCSIGTTIAFDTNECCLGTCKEEEPECERFNFNCRISCLENEEFNLLYKCPSGEICCKEKEKKGGIPWFVWLLIILIILVILGIIFRNKLRVLIFKFRSGFKKGPVTKTRPGFPPAPPMLRRMFPTRPMAPVGIRRAVKRVATQTDKELEETLKKLREMSKGE